MCKRAPLLAGTHWEGQQGDSNCCFPIASIAPRSKTKKTGTLSYPCPIGARGLEPPTSSSRTKRATGLRYAPIHRTLYART